MSGGLLEALVSITGIAFCCFLIYVSVADNGIYSVKQFVFVTITSAAGMYSLVRFIHWAWLTPIPFVSS